ncbi:DUF1493 family protein [Flavobacterium quisquiliarum]|jgi:acyl carrier protein|uniref:DUF1493 family protein n=1 Tax=Flavobacterium quisquiliarum TaxID=1834436 RepID=A0ABV8WC66_9FLAO|nr:DUF1493 family protein [Flavobacterium quisquiliarum]MBW1657933.1 DUF1493 family protein [Flavobacterium quisquiliarum]NWL00991.1 hypothetical protein [Flavobacterium collinsii]
MNNNIKLYQFLKEETGKTITDTSPNWKIEKDLGIYGDEAEEFITRFSNKFNVDISDFDFVAYFNSETDVISLLISRLFYKKEKKELTINDLREAIKKGKLT